jgi:hypothetical protein
MKRISRHLLGVAAAITMGLLFAPSHAAVPADVCASSGTASNGYNACTNPLTDTSVFVAARSDPGLAGGPIDVWGFCRYVDNSAAATSIFAPFKSSPDWLAFLKNPPGAVALTHCARPTTATISPDARCVSPSPAAPSVDLPYQRTGTTLTATASFKCGGAPSWIETATATYNALDSDVATPSWALANIAYAGSPSTTACNPAIYTAACQNTTPPILNPSVPPGTNPAIAP